MKKNKSMKTGILVFLVSLLLVVPPALAFVGTNQNNGKSSLKDKEDEHIISTITPTVTIPVSNSLNTWKNHGQYVSSIARSDDDNRNVSEAAKADIGKKNDDKDDDENENEDDEIIIKPVATKTPTPTPTPTSNPTVTPTPVPTVVPDSTPTPTVTVTPASTLSNRHVNILLSDLDKFFARLEELFNSIVKY